MVYQALAAKQQRAMSLKQVMWRLQHVTIL